MSMDPGKRTEESAAKISPRLEVRGLHVHYGNIHALHGVDLAVGKGEIVSVVGANGAGKSTLMWTVAGVLPLSGGAVLLDGSPLPPRPHEIVELGVSLVPERRRLFTALTVRENLIMGAIRRSDGDEIASDMERCFELYPVLKERLSQRSGTLSGGEQQMLAIGRAMIAKPKMILLDEPSEGIMPVLVEEMGVLFRRLRDQGVTLLLVEQNVEWALKLADRAVIIDQGEVVHRSTAAALLADKAIQERYCAV